MLIFNIMKGMSKYTAGIFIILFMVLTSVTVAVIEHAMEQSKLKTMISPSYFQLYSDPTLDRPDRIIDQPDGMAYPQSRYEFPYIGMNITQGTLSIDGESETSVDAFTERVSSSDDKYGSILPTISSSSISLLSNYYIFEDKEGNYFPLPLSPSMDHYLAFDSIDGTSGTIIDNSSIDEITSSFVIANDPYLLPNNGTYISFEGNSTAESVSLSVSSGGVTIYNSSLYSLYSILDSHREEIINGKVNPESLLAYFFSDTQAQYYEFSILYSIIQARNRQFFTWFAEKCFSYDEFLNGIGIEMDKGYRVFAKFNPYAVSEIRGKIALYIDNYDPTRYPEIVNYSVQCYNYIAERWVTIMTRREDPQLSLVNTWLYDTFVINSNAWQYIYDFNGDSELAGNFIKWRVVVNGVRDPNDDAPIRVRLGGIWTSIKQNFKEFNARFSFKLNESGIAKRDISSARFIIEYHTENWDPLYDGIYVTHNIGEHTFSESYYDIQTDTWKLLSYSVSYQSVLDNGEIYASPVRDNRIGVTVPNTMIADDTEIVITLAGRFAPYTRNGEESHPKVWIDKVSMEYQYEKPIPIKRKTWVYYDSLDLFYWTYDINVSSHIVSLEFSYPTDWIFIDKYFALVEKLDSGENVSYMWIDSKNDPSMDDLYENGLVRMDFKTTFYLGAGTYRFWFRSFNYLSDLSVFNSTGGECKNGERVKINDTTFYNVTLNGNWKNPAIKRNYDGGLEVTFSGYGSDGKTIKTIGPFYGKQYSYVEGGTTKWNKWYLNYTHLYEDGIYGYIKVIVYWHNFDHDEIGIAVFWLYITYASDRPPIVSVISPTDGGRWGITKTNYIIAASWHSSTIGTYADVDGTFIPLERLSSALESNEAIPEELVGIPSQLRDFFWFVPINVSDIVGNVEPSTDIEINVWSVAYYSGNDLYSDNTTIRVSVVSSPNFKIDPLANVPIGEKARLTYYCPEGIEKMSIYINDGLTSIKVLEIRNDAYVHSSYLYKGYHTLYVPYRFSSAGVYTISVSVTDDVGNTITITSNEFSVVNTDDRVWILKVFDNLTEISLLWASYLFGGFIYVRKKMHGRM